MGRAKTVHTIEYRGKGASLDIPLKLVSEKSSRDGKPPSFTYRIEIFDPIDFQQEGPDPKELTDQLFARLDQHFELSWSPFLYVRTNIGSVNANYCGSNTTGRQMSILVDYVLIGTKPDGSKVHAFYDGEDQRHNCGPFRPRFNSYGKGMPETHAGKKRWDVEDRDDRASVALVADTDENRAALKAIQDAMVTLAEKLGDILSPDQIQAALSEMPAGLLIGMGDSK